MPKTNDPPQPTLPELQTASIRLTELEKELIRNVHPGYGKIILEKEFGGGYSGSRVFLVLPVRPDGGSDAQVVTKIGPASELRQEKENYDNYAGPALPFTATQITRSYEQNDLSAVNYAFAGGNALGKTISLEEYYLAQPAEAINKTLDGLLDKALGATWYGQHEPLHNLFSIEYGQHLPDYENLEGIVKAIFPNLLHGDSNRIQIPGVDGSYPDPLKVYSGFLDKTLKARRSFVHGDLHLRNVLVDESGKGWLIDYAKIRKRHNLFDFIKLETYVRLMGLAQMSGAFSFSEYAQFEWTLDAATLGQNSTPPANPHLAKAYHVIRTIRRIARKHMGPDPDFKDEYFPALFLYGLTMLRYYSSNNSTPTQLAFITTCVLDHFILEWDEHPAKPSDAGTDSQLINNIQNQPGSAPQTAPSPESDERVFDTDSGAIAQGSGGTAVGEQGVSIGGNAQGSPILTGDSNQISQTKKNINTDGGIYIEGNVYNASEPLKELSANAPLQRRARVANFINRTKEIEELISVLMPGNVVTLLGPKGIGKTVLVIEVLWKLTPDGTLPKDFPDGIVFVKFGENISNLESAYNKIIAAFREVKQSTDPTPLDAVERILSRRKALLVFDAPELIENDLTQLLDIRGNCCVLITSSDRTYAKIANATQDVLPLPLEHAIDLLRVWSGEKTAKDQVMEEICELVGMLPLAIYLIGRYLSEHGQDIDEYLRYMKEGTLIDLPELKELKLVLDKNISGLSSTGQQALAMIGLLANHSFKKDVVADMMEMKLPATTRILGDLVASGLLLYNDEDDRYQAGHSLIHTYAQGQVYVFGKEYENRAVDKLIQHFFTLVQKAPRDELLDDEEAHILVTLQRIRERYDDNLLAYKQMVDFINRMDPFWESRDEHEKRVKWLEEAYDCAEKIDDLFAQADFATRIGRALGWLGRLDKAFKWMAKVEIVLTGNKSSAAKKIRARMHIQRASLYFMKKDIVATEKDCHRGLKLSVATDHQNLAEGYNLLGVIQAIKGDLSQALDSFEKSRKSWQVLNDDYQLARVDDNISSAHFYQGNIAQARAAGEISLQYWEKHPKRIELAMALTNLGLVYHCQGQHQSAFDLHSRAIEISDRIGVQRIRALTRVNIAWPYIALESFDAAETYLIESLEIQTKYDIKENWIEAHRAQAEVALGRKLKPQALELAQKALDLAREVGDPLEEGAALRILGKAQHLNGNLEQAREDLEKSFARLNENEYKYESFLTLQALVKLYEEIGDVEKAQIETKHAQTLSDEMGLLPPETSSDKNQGLNS